MHQKKRPVSRGPHNTSNYTDSLSWVAGAREAVLRAARIEDHAARAGFRTGRNRRWYCGAHEDRNPSCSIHKGSIRCWPCGQSWNVIDLEMMASGVPFLKALRSLAAEYGIPIDDRPYDPAQSKRDAQARAEQRERAFSWRAGYLDLIDDLLATEKAKLFDFVDGPADIGLIRSLTELERKLRTADSAVVLWRMYQVHNETGEELTAQLVAHGKAIRQDRERFGEWLLDRMAAMEGQC